MGDTIFDKQNALQLLGDDEDFLNIVVDAFLNYIPGQIAALQNAVTAGNEEAARLLAHSLKGASANIAATRLHGISTEMETLAKANALEKMAPLLTPLIAAFDEFKRHVRE